MFKVFVQQYYIHIIRITYIYLQYIYIFDESHK